MFKIGRLRSSSKSNECIDESRSKSGDFAQQCINLEIC